MKLCLDCKVEDLLFFLQNSELYTMQLAFNYCQKNNPPLYKELIYLNTKTNNIQEAIRISIEKLDDAEGAIKLVNDEKLEEYLIDLCLKKGENICKLLKEIKNLRNPLIFLNKIPPDLKIKNLKKTIVDIMSEFTFHKQLHGSYNQIIKQDLNELLERK